MSAKLIEFHHPRKPLVPPQVTPLDLGRVRVSIGRQRFTIRLSGTIVSGEPPTHSTPEAEAPPRKMPEPPEGSESRRDGEDSENVVLDSIVQDHVECMMEKYGSMTEADLQALTQHEAPWIVARAIAVGERFVIANQDMKLFYRYPANDIFIRVVAATYRMLVHLKIYQTSTAASAWTRKAWEAWKIICSQFGMLT